MKVAVKAGRCRGYGYCHDTAPAVFDLDDSGFNSLVATASAEVPAGLESEARTGIESCPVKALVGDDSDAPGDGG